MKPTEVFFNKLIDYASKHKNTEICEIIFNEMWKCGI